MNTERTAVVTGATSDRGIGMTVAQRYAREGWAVVILDLDGEKSAKVAADIGNQFAVPAFAHAVDVTSVEAVIAAHDAVAAGGGRPLRRRRARGRHPKPAPSRRPREHRRHHITGAIPRNHP